MLVTRFFLVAFLLVSTTHLIGQYVPTYVPTSGLVGLWGFNGNAQDGSGNGNHGTVNGTGVTLTSNRLNNPNSAYFFNGSNSWISIPHSSGFNFGNSMSVSAWVNKMGVMRMALCA
jgi:hypothetical protein